MDQNMGSYAMHPIVFRALMHSNFFLFFHSGQLRTVSYNSFYPILQLKAYCFFKPTCVCSCYLCATFEPTGKLDHKVFRETLDTGWPWKIQLRFLLRFSQIREASGLNTGTFGHLYTHSPTETGPGGEPGKTISYSASTGTEFICRSNWIFKWWLKN